MIDVHSDSKNGSDLQTEDTRVPRLRRNIAAFPARARGSPASAPRDRRRKKRLGALPRTWIPRRADCTSDAGELRGAVENRELPPEGRRATRRAARVAARNSRKKAKMLPRGGDEGQGAVVKIHSATLPGTSALERRTDTPARSILARLPRGIRASSRGLTTTVAIPARNDPPRGR